MAYNLTNLSSATTVQDIIVFANDITNGTIVGMLMISIFFVLMMAMRKQGTMKGLLVSSFICFTLSLILRFADLLSLWYAIVFLGILVFVAFEEFVLSR